jgi:hypothetical protein
MKPWLVALLLPLAAMAQEAPPMPEHPRIVGIAFAGNDVTRPEVMLREMTVAVGDAADPEQLRRSAQYIKDLGLFADVAIDTQPVEGGVRLQVTVDERWYLLPYPRYSVNVEGQCRRTQPQPASELCAHRAQAAGPRR